MSQFRLDDRQLQFFDTFGFLSFPGMLSDCIDEIIESFEAVWDERGSGHDGKAHDGSARSCIVPFIDQHERLCALLDDPRVEGLLCSLLGDDFNYMGSDGNYYSGDTRWHSDGWREGELRFVKVALYLDHLTRDSGCLRVIPGSHRFADAFAEALQGQIRESEDLWGIEGAAVPAQALKTNPGDVLVFNHNTKHAAFGGGRRRRMFTINCCQRIPEEHIQVLKDYIGGHSRFWIDRMYGETMVDTAPDRRMVHLEQVRANDGHLAELTAKARAERAEPSRG